MHKCKYDRENYMNPFLLVAIKLLIGFFAMVIIINISGKGNLAPTSASDQIVNYVLGGIIGGVIYNSNVKILDFVGILCIWCALVLALKWVKKHNVKAKQIIDGKALIIIDDGEIDVDNCRKLGLSAHDVAFKLRTNGINSSKDVKRAVIEQNGQLIVIKAGEENPKFPVITDGQVHADILKIIGKDEKWLLEEIKKHGVDKYSKVFLGEYVDNSLTLTTYK
jgi:putative membrane protein